MSQLDSRTEVSMLAPSGRRLVLGAGPDWPRRPPCCWPSWLTRSLVLDRDAAEPGGIPPTRSWSEWNRPGVNEFRQAHIALPRWYQVMRDEAPRRGRRPALTGPVGGSTSCNCTRVF